MPDAAPPASPASDAPLLGQALRAFALDELANAARQLAREGGERHAGIHQARQAHGTIAEVDELLGFIEGAPRGVCRAAGGRA